MDTAALIRDKLLSLQPLQLELDDESHRHAGHVGAQSGGGHYKLFIVSECFAGQTRIARHRTVFDALGRMMHREIHALSITALTPLEAGQRTSGTAQDSPTAD